MAVKILALRRATLQLGRATWQAGPRFNATHEWLEGRQPAAEIVCTRSTGLRDGKYAAELVALAPEVILASGTMSVAALQALSRTLPIVFAAVADPAGAGFVESLATQAATRLASCFMNTVGAGRCLNSSGRSHRT
jgi:hypothetical protein